MSETKSLAAAMIQAQLNMPKLFNSADNPYFKSKYAPLSEVVNAALPTLGKAGIAVMQGASTDWESGRPIVYVSCRFVHAASGEEWAEEIRLLPEKSTPQAIGSSITYGRRYLLTTMSGLAAMDDDGNEASGNNTQPQRQQAINRNSHTAPVIDRGIPQESPNGVAFATPAVKARVKPKEPLADVHSLDDIEEIRIDQDELPFADIEPSTEEEEAIAEDPMTPYHMLSVNPDWGIAEHDIKTIQTIRDADKRKPVCTPAGYGKVVGRLMALDIGDDKRKYVLATLFGRTITKDVRPSSAAASSLYKWLAPEDEDGDAQVRQLVSEEIPAAIQNLISEDLWETA